MPTDDKKPMKCEDVRQLLDLHIDGELPDSVAVRLDRHLLRCSLCAGELRSLEQTRSLLREAVPVAAVEPGFRERTVALLCDRLAEHLLVPPAREVSGQWTLPFPRSDS